jgi:hypothetical protein
MMLKEQEKQTLFEEISRYGSETAGTSDDLDEQLEAAGVEQALIAAVDIRR